MGCGSTGKREEDKRGKPSQRKSGHPRLLATEDKKGRPVPEVKITSDPNPYQDKDMPAEPLKEAKGNRH